MEVSFIKLPSDEHNSRIVQYASWWRANVTMMRESGICTHDVCNLCGEIIFHRDKEADNGFLEEGRKRLIEAHMEVHFLQTGGTRVSTKSVVFIGHNAPQVTSGRMSHLMIFDGVDWLNYSQEDMNKDMAEGHPIIVTQPSEEQKRIAATRMQKFLRGDL